jgi:hypothetical protein
MPEAKSAFTLRKVFCGPNGIRAGWRILLFFAIFLSLVYVLDHLPWLAAWQKWRNSKISPGSLLVREAMWVFVLLVALFIMTWIEKRSLADYFLPPNQAFGKRFFQGLAYGFAMLSLLMGAIGALHGFSIGGLALSSGRALEYGALFGVALILVGLFEELSFRGYLQSTLGSGIGFWPAGIVLSTCFGANHLSNAGETWIGIMQIVCFGLLCVFTLKRTGNIWFAIGMHASWDWGEDYFYSVPDSGNQFTGHLFNSSFHGPTWLTGGSVGPEGSVFVFAVLILAAVGIHFLFPAKKNVA